MEDQFSKLTSDEISIKKEPVREVYYFKGTDIIKCEFWVIDYKCHREDGPAEIHYYRNGRKLV